MQNHRKPEQDLAEVARRVVLLARNRHGQLAGITVGVCEHMEAERCAQELRENLAQAGHTDVSVDVVQGASAACAELLSLDFRW